MKYKANRTRVQGRHYYFFHHHFSMNLNRNKKIVCTLHHFTGFYTAIDFYRFVLDAVVDNTSWLFNSVAFVIR